MFYIQNYTVHKCSVFSLWTHSICPHTFMSMSGVTAVMAAVMLPSTYQQTRETHDFTLSNSTRLDIR